MAGSWQEPVRGLKTFDKGHEVLWGVWSYPISPMRKRRLSAMVGHLAYFLAFDLQPAFENAGPSAPLKNASLRMTASRGSSR